MCAAGLAAVLSGCAGTGGTCTEPTSFMDRVQRQHRDGLIVEATALGRCESLDAFGVALNDIDIQPVWLRVTSFREEPQWLLPTAIDEDYFPTYEVARRAAGISAFGVDDLYARYLQDEMKWFVAPQASVAGFVFTHSDEGMKAFHVELIGASEAEVFSFVAPVPGLPTTYFEVDEAVQETMHGARDLEPDGLREWLGTQDCCTRNLDGVAGDPLNIVLVGSLDQVRSALITRHWDVTAPIDAASLRRMVTSFVFGGRFRYAPISRLYLFGREQDMSFQKARALIDERNHMRLWLAPVTVSGQSVWIGQVSRDVGVKLSGRLWPPTTHVIDPEVDDARFYLMQDLAAAGVLERIGFAHGQTPAPPATPHHNAERDPYFTDGLRNVFFLTDRRVELSEIRLLDWELPGAMEAYRGYFIHAQP